MKPEFGVMKLYAAAICTSTLLGLSLAVHNDRPVKAGNKPSHCNNSEPALIRSTSRPTQITTSNYAFAETEVILSEYVQKISKATCSGGVGVYRHLRAAMDPTDRTIVRPNFDTMYSFAVLDLNNPATIVMPDTDRLMILSIVSGDHYMPLVVSEPGSYSITEELVGTRYAFSIIRTQVNMNDSNDIKKVASLQDRVKIIQSDKGEFIQTENWDKAERLSMRSEYLKKQKEDKVTSKDMFGKKGEVTPENRNIGVAYGWGGLPEKAAVYPVIPIPNSSSEMVLTLKDVPIAENAFWSVTIYDKDGFVKGKNFNINSTFAKQQSKGDYKIHFGADSSQDNFLEIYPGSNATLRIYSPQKPYFDGRWKVPTLQTLGN